VAPCGSKLSGDVGQECGGAIRKGGRGYCAVVHEKKQQGNSRKWGYFMLLALNYLSGHGIFLLLADSLR
jgi:hypothetical protein